MQIDVFILAVLATILTATTLLAEVCDEVLYPQEFLDCKSSQMRCETGLAACQRNQIFLDNCLNLVNSMFENTVQNVIKNCECDVVCNSSEIIISSTILLLIILLTM